MKKYVIGFAAIALAVVVINKARAGFDLTTISVLTETAVTATDLDSNCLVPVFDTDADGDSTQDATDTDSRGIARFVTCTDVYGLGAAKAGSFTTGAFTGDVNGDGGDQLYGFRQDQVASTTVAITIAQCGKTFISNSADVMTLPEASTALGCRYTFVCGTADDFDIDPADGTDYFSSISTTNGTTGVVTLAPSAGDEIRCTDIGGSITIEAIAADVWAQVGGGNGIWTDVD